MRYLIFIIVASLLSGCNRERRALEAEIESFIGTTITISDTLEFRNNGTLYTSSYFDSADFKIINYIDTAGCEECKLHLYDWGRFQRELDTINCNVKVCFVVWSADIEPLERLARVHRFNFPLLYDSAGIFERTNSIPNLASFRTCLVDSSNKVLLVGSPLYNRDLKSLYYDLFE
ncbi:MAG: hypothetical protein J6K74_02710 [Marinifilaceae bacterium]|nr:hypothetical protein [Marinifilaceae bacterium]